MAIRGNFPGEVAAIRRIRQANPNVGAKTLAKGIVSRDFADPAGVSVSHRSLLSTYSVIRRYDAAVKAGKQPALAEA